jgi:hypothetical protein
VIIFVKMNTFTPKRIDTVWKQHILVGSNRMAYQYQLIPIYRSNNNFKYGLFLPFQPNISFKSLPLSITIFVDNTKLMCKSKEQYQIIKQIKICTISKIGYIYPFIKLRKVSTHFWNNYKAFGLYKILDEIA